MKSRLFSIILILTFAALGLGCGIDASIVDLNPQVSGPIIYKGEVSTANGARGVGSSYSVSGDGKYYVRSTVSSMSSRVSTRSNKYSVTLR